MTLTTLAIIVVAGLLLILLCVVMLNRAWGDFPSRISSPVQRPAELSSGPAWATAPAEDEGSDDEDEGDAWGEEPGLPAGASSENLIPVTNPQVKRAIEAALSRAGSPYATYFIREGDQVFLVASRIADPVQRVQVVRAFQGLNGGDMSGVNMVEVFHTFRQLGK